MTDPSRRANILGVGVDVIDLASAIDRVQGWIDHRQPSYAIFRDVHGIMLSQRDPELRRIHAEAGLVGADGMPLVWISRWQGNAGASRVYGPDFMLEFCQSTAGKGYRHFFFGSTPQTVERLIGRLRARVPEIQVAGWIAPPFRELTKEGDENIVNAIDTARADIVWVGLGTPKQEFWMANHRARLSAPALLGVGAAFDFHSGTKPQAPLWLRRNGLEWAFRLGTEPRRLAARYARHIPAFLFQAGLQATGLKQFDIR